MIRRPPVGGSGARRIWSAYDERVGQVASRRWGGLDNRAQCRRCVGPAPVGRIIDEQFPQVLVTPVQAGHDGADWGAHDVGDFLVSEALDVGEIDHYPELLGQRLQGLADVGVGQPLQGWRPRWLQLAGALGGGLGGLPVLGVPGPRALRFPLPRAVGVDKGVREDPEQPGLEVGALLEQVERRVRRTEGVLHQVFGVGPVVGHPHRGGIYLVQVGQYITLETGAAPLEGVRDRIRFLGYPWGHVDGD
jgi:hypothetical protein